MVDSALESNLERKGEGLNNIRKPIYIQCFYLITCKNAGFSGLNRKGWEDLEIVFSLPKCNKVGEFANYVCQYFTAKLQGQMHMLNFTEFIWSFYYLLHF